MTNKKILFTIFSILLISSVSAFSLGDFFGKITGKAVDEGLAAEEQVKCVFANVSSAGIGIATSVLGYYQKCYTGDGKFSCSGLNSCVADVSGSKGQELTWKSSCGESTSATPYRTTTIDGVSEYAEFDCSPVYDSTPSNSLTLFLTSEQTSLSFVYSNKNYVVELISASDNQATIKVTDEDGNYKVGEIFEGERKMFTDVPIQLVEADEKNLFISVRLLINLDTSVKDLVKEQVKCVFVNSNSIQTCYSASSGSEEKFSCSGVGTCVADVSGINGDKITWKSTCGGYDYATIDGKNDYVDFDCLNAANTDEQNTTTSDTTLVNEETFLNATYIELDSYTPSIKFLRNDRIYRIDLLSASDNRVKIRIIDEDGNYKMGDLLEGTSDLFTDVPVKLIDAEEENIFISADLLIAGSIEIKSRAVNVVAPNDSTGPIDVPAYEVSGPGFPDENQTSAEIILSNSCQGCLENEKCFPYGHRLDSKFCSAENLRFTAQYGENNFCENNFECGSNVCVSGKCIETGLIQKILNYFRNLFG